MKELSNTTAARMSVTSAVSLLGRPVAFYPSIARAFGDVSTALIVCQFMYWRGRVGEREIYKTQAEIEQETCVPAHTQRRVLKRLSSLGMVTVEKKGIPARNHFEWHWDAVDTFVSDYILQSQQTVTTSANKLSPLDVTDCHDKTEQSVTTNTETTTETTTEITQKDLLSGKPDAGAVEKSLLDYLNTSAGRNYKPVPSNIKLLRARLAEGHTPQEIADVIARKCAEWLDDPKMNQYLRPATLFNAEKFNTYVGQLNSPLPVKHKTRPDHMNGYTHGEKLQEEYRRFLNGHTTAAQNHQRLLAKNDGNLQPGLVEYNDDVGF